MDNEYPSDVESDEITYSTNNSRKIGQFHTLCVDCNENMTGIVSVGLDNFSVGDSFDIMNYFKERDLDFYNFYHKEIKAMNNGPYYNVVTIDHPLSGFKAGDILPESVWCINFHPSCKNWDGMVYCNAVNCCVDIYLQSGTGLSTASEYNAVHTINRQWLNHCADMQAVGKNLLTVPEFIQAASGSNERTYIYGGDQSTVGGHSDTNGRRMISFIGCEECCGYLYQWCEQISEYTEAGNPRVDDGRGLMGTSSGDLFVSIKCGGVFNNPESGSRSIDAYQCQSANYINGARGRANVLLV